MIEPEGILNGSYEVVLTIVAIRTAQTTVLASSQIPFGFFSVISNFISLKVLTYVANEYG